MQLFHYPLFTLLPYAHSAMQFEKQLLVSKMYKEKKQTPPDMYSTARKMLRTPGSDEYIHDTVQATRSIASSHYSNSDERKGKEGKD